MKAALLAALAVVPLVALSGSAGLGVPDLPDRVFVLAMSGAAFNGFSHPSTPLLEAEVGDRVEISVLVPLLAEPHTFHMHGHPWWSETHGRFIDTVLLQPGQSHSFTVVAGGPDGHAGDWMYHCHFDEHMRGGMWGIFRVHEPGQMPLVPGAPRHAGH